MQFTMEQIVEPTELKYDETLKLKVIRIIVTDIKSNGWLTQYYLSDDFKKLSLHFAETSPYGAQHFVYPLPRGWVGDSIVKAKYSQSWNRITFTLTLWNSDTDPDG